MLNPIETLPFHLALWRTPSIGPVHFAKTLSVFPDLSELFKLTLQDLKACGFSEDAITAIQKPDWKGVENDLKWATMPAHHIITQAMPSYPPLLKEISNAPPILFVIGDASLLLRPQLAMVGSRNPTPGGTDTAYLFAKHLAQSGLIVTSGLALGVDASCHAGALATNGKTIAVMGTGPDKIYPARHKPLAKEIAERGALVTEFPTGIVATAANFPRRNRIISGLSTGVLVVEAAFSSGSLITAQYALEQGREVFAIPGSIHNPLARGCHALLRQGAKLVETAQDILDEIGALREVMNPAKQQQIGVELVPEQQKVLGCLGFETTPIDLLIERSRLTADAVSSILLLLELQGYVTTAPGGYIRIR